MYVGLVAPAPVPPTLGGAERLWRSLGAELEARGHRVEQVALPTPETTLAEVLEGYRAFCELDVSRFDLVVTGKYPAWMVTHPCHVRYLLHPLRGLYDTYPRSLPTLASSARGRELLARLDAAGPEPPALIEAGADLLAELGEDPIAAHPGPLGRELVRRLDAWATAPGRIALHAAISEEVATRPGYIPDGRPVAVLHPASDLPVVTDAEPLDAFVAPSRLDHPKRLDLVIDAFACVTDPHARLLVCGDGPQRRALEARAARDPRIELRGFVDDAELARLYAGAVAVPFVPDREDFGYVALEAARAGTPVITTTDAGGARELITDGIDGLVVAPTAHAVGRAMQRLWTDRALAWRLGALARLRADRVSWDPMVRLLESVADRRVRPRAVSLSTFSIDPPLGGGQRRLRHLLRGLAERADVTALCLVATREGIRRRVLEPGLVQVEVGRSEPHLAADAAMAAVAGFPVDDIGCAELWPATPAWERELAAAIRPGAADDTAEVAAHHGAGGAADDGAEGAADDGAEGAAVLVASHPFLTSGVPAESSATLVYEAQDAEADLKARLLPAGKGGRWLLERAVAAERLTVERAALVSTTTPEDQALIAGLVGAEVAALRRWEVAPNGVDTVAMPLRSPEEHRRARKLVLALVGLQPEDLRTLIVFVGSWHPPNIEAAELLIALARARPDMLVVLAGSHTQDLRDPPANVRLLGAFPETLLWPLLAAADVAVNPMTSGSGSNLKLLDYLAVGVPVVTTATGARGVTDPSSVAVVVPADVASLAAGVDTALADSEETARRVKAGRRLAEDTYDWGRIARHWTDAVLDAAGCPDAPARDVSPPESPTIHLAEPPLMLLDPVVALVRAIRARAVTDQRPSPPQERPMYERLHQALDRAAANRNVGQVLPPGARLAAAKKAVIRVGKVLSTEQREFNEATLEALAVLAEHAGAVDARLGGIEAHLRSEVEDRFAEVRDEIEALRDQVHDLIRTRTRLTGELHAVQASQKVLLREARAALAALDPAGAGDVTGDVTGDAVVALRRLAEAVESSVDGRLDDLYQDFEDAYRGSVGEVTDVLREHLALVEHLAGGDAPVLDVGCGRGEWLRLCAEAGIPAYGVDTNAVAVRRVTEAGLDARHGDAVVHLRDEVAPGTLGAVTAFHVIEHLPFETLVELTDAALAALRPGGVLVYETPDCRNLQVGASSFWLDPTHIRPVHPDALGFLLTQRGFVDVEVIGLHPREDEVGDGLHGATHPDAAVNGFLATASRLLFGPNDVVVIGRRMGPAAS